MSYGFLDIAITPSVRAAQAKMGADHIWQDFKGHRAFDRFTENERAFIADRDSFYMATVSETGWPYVQHRGGPRGFLRVVDDRTLAFADYRGNRQYITQGNLAENAQAFIIAIDYRRRQRVKIWGRARVVDDPVVLAQLRSEGYRAKAEQAILFAVEAWCANCPSHIPQMLPASEVAAALARLQERIQDLEAENAALRGARATGS